MKKEASFWRPIAGGKVQCFLCPHHCVIAPEKHGICGVRKNENGTLFSLIYGSCSSIADDPIEKKPLYHFYPGSLVLSFGSVGCTFRCEHCQNFSISMADPSAFSLQEIQPEAVVGLAREHGCRGVAWTYNEPTIWHEYTLETAKLVKEAGLYTVYVTNGYIEEDPLKELAPYLDAMNIDVKAFHENFYKKVCKARLAPVLSACERAKQLGIHVELTYLIIPDLNDAAEELSRFCGWVHDSLSPDTPVHFSRFHPDYKMQNKHATPTGTLMQAYEIAKKAHLQFVYLGNIPHSQYENTLCPRCGNLLVERFSFSAQVRGLDKGKCSQCGAVIPLLMD